MNIKMQSAAFVGILTMLLSVLTAVPVAAQKTSRAAASRIVSAAPGVSAVLTDSFADSDGDGKAKPGDEITYAATIVNNGTTDATNVVYTDRRDAATSLVADSVQVRADNRNVLRCVFTTANAGRGECSLPSDEYIQTDSANYAILGGQSSLLKLTGVNPLYDAGTQTFQFDATVQNLLGQALGTIDNVTVENTGVRLFLNAAAVTSGSGVVSFANPDGTDEFTAPDQPYALYRQILAPNEVTPPKTLRFNVPNTVTTFTLDFLVSAGYEAKLVINEVMANPNGLSGNEQPMEWFEVYNAGRFPVYLQGFRIGDSAASGDRPTHPISAPDLIIQSGAYLVFGGSANPTTNGGVPVDYAYGAALNLANSLDAVRILSPYHVDPSPGDPEGNVIEIDRVRYANASISAKEGISRELKNPSLQNFIMDDSNWADASVTSVYGAGGRGTPKAQNSAYTPFWAGNQGTSSDKSGVGAVSGWAGENDSSGQFQAAPLAGETVSVNVGTIAPGGSATVTYKVIIANPLPAGTTEISAQGTITGDGFSTATDDPAGGGASDATVTPVAFVPTAAPVSISGRVTTASGRGIRNVVITLTDAQGGTRATKTGIFGSYRFDDIAAGETVTLSAAAKQYRFAQSTIVRTTGDAIADADFVSEP